VAGHFAGVRGGGFGEDEVETKRRKALTGAGFVGGGEEILFGDRQVIFWARGALGVEIVGHRCESEGCDGERFRQ